MNDATFLYNKSVEISGKTGPGGAASFQKIINSLHSNEKIVFQFNAIRASFNNINWKKCAVAITDEGRIIWGRSSFLEGNEAYYDKFENFKKADTNWNTVNFILNNGRSYNFEVSFGAEKISSEFNKIIDLKLFTCQTLLYGCALGTFLLEKDIMCLISTPLSKLVNVTDLKKYPSESIPWLYRTDGIIGIDINMEHQTEELYASGDITVKLKNGRETLISNVTIDDVQKFGRKMSMGKWKWRFVPESSYHNWKDSYNAEYIDRIEEARKIRLEAENNARIEAERKKQYYENVYDHNKMNLYDKLFESGKVSLDTIYEDVCIKYRIVQA